MWKRSISLVTVLILICTLLTGCGFWMDGEYASVTPHVEQNFHEEAQVVEASSPEQIRNALAGFVEKGWTSGVISVSPINDATLRYNMDEAIKYTMSSTPVGAYAVEMIDYEVGTNGGVKALAVSISYRNDRTAVADIKAAEQMSDATDILYSALRAYSPGVTVLVDQYTPTDVEQMIRDYCYKNPDVVMQAPEVTASVYPDNGDCRIVDVAFTYQTSKEALRHMQDLVTPVFTSAELYVQGAAQVREKYAQIQAFLMERFEYTIDTTNTPAYSLLLTGVGDCEAFARVYAAMCRRADLECYVITGTRRGEPWSWNLIYFRGGYYHLDLLESTEFSPLHKSEMVDYVWDDAAFPD